MPLTDGDGSGESSQAVAGTDVLWDLESKPTFNGTCLAQQHFVREDGSRLLIFFHTQLSSICYLPGTVLGPAETIMKKT